MDVSIVDSSVVGSSSMPMYPMPYRMATGASYPAASMEELRAVARVAPSQRHESPPSPSTLSPLGQPNFEPKEYNGTPINYRRYERQEFVRQEMMTNQQHVKAPTDATSKIFGSKAELQVHTQLHMRESKPYKCTQCNKSFANASYLSQHTRIHLGIKPYKCETCGKRFTQVSNLQQHMRMHRGEKRHTCEICHKKFAQLSHLQQHNRMHLGIKPYKCEICQRKFTQLSHLQQHIRTHTGDKPYKCKHPGCTKAFSQLSNLQSHSRSHQTDKPFKCNSCYKCFADEQSLLEHIPKHKESKHLKTHICPYCGKSYTQASYLAKHMQKHADRQDKRAPINANTNNNANANNANNNNNGANNGASMANGVNNVNNAVNSVANSASNTLSSVSNSLASTMAPNNGLESHYWPKMDYHERVAEYTQVANLMDPRLNQPLHDTRSMVDPMHGHYNESMLKSSSAFSPIQAAGMLNPQNFAHVPAAASRNYFYDPIPFPKHHPQMGFDGKSAGGGSNCFPNQLISLSQIRNYAHQPTATAASSADLLHSLKEKVTQ